MTDRPEAITYNTVVDYEKIDVFKREGQAAAFSTATNLQRFGHAEDSASRGESSFVWDEGDRYRAGVIEGLGTKDLVADAVDQTSEESYYGAIAQDSIAIIVNDLIVSGADPQLFWVHVAPGESSWYDDERRNKAFNLGLAAVCNELGMTWGGGESPALPDVVLPNAAVIDGFILGQIYPKERYVRGNTLEEGDAIVLVESSGIHANGLSSARHLADRLPDGYDTVLPDGSKFGETLLEPSILYVKLVQSLLDRGVALKRMENITGHGWRKLMRAQQTFTYRINDLPPSMPIFDFLRDGLGVDDAEMFGNYNMGAGFALYTPKASVGQAISTAESVGLTAWHAGNVESGPRQVIIDPLRLVYESASLTVRNQ